MPRFFFHVRDGLSAPDVNGTILQSIDQARTEAVRFAGEVITQHAQNFWQRGEWALEVKSHDGLTLFVLHFGAVEAPVLSRPMEALLS